MALASVDTAVDHPALRPPSFDTKCNTPDVRITHRTTTTTSAAAATTTTTTSSSGMPTTTTRSHSPLSAASIAPAATRTAAGKAKAAPPSSADADEALNLLMPPSAAPSSTFQMLLDRYVDATACKMYDVEELIDYYFHRRLAAVTAVIISALPFVITPNQITVFGLVFGWGAAACVYDAQFHTLPFGWSPQTSLGLGALLMFLWIVSDCADGQVARLCKRGTRTGRFLDGLIDLMVMFANCFVLLWVVGDRYGQEYTRLAWFSGMSLWLHCITYDKVKNRYMENALPQSESDNESVESVMAEYKESFAKHPFSLDTTLFGIYVVYLAGQAILTSDVSSMKKEHRFNKQRDEQSRRAYRQKYAHVMRWASWMGLSAHVTGMYVGYFFAMFDFAALYYTLLYFGIVLNVVLVITWTTYVTSGMGSATAATMLAP